MRRSAGSGLRTEAWCARGEGTKGLVFSWGIVGGFRAGARVGESWGVDGLNGPNRHRGGGSGWMPTGAALHTAAVAWRQWRRRGSARRGCGRPDTTRQSGVRHRGLTCEVAVVVSRRPPAGGVAKAVTRRVAEKHLRMSCGKTQALRKVAEKSGAKSVSSGRFTAPGQGALRPQRRKLRLGNGARDQEALAGRSPPGESAAP